MVKHTVRAASVTGCDLRATRPCITVTVASNTPFPLCLWPSLQHCQFYGINLGVGLSVAIPGFASQIAHGMLGNMPFGTVSMVGVRSLDEAQRARASGADCLLIKKELMASHLDNVPMLANQLAYLVSGDD